MGESEERPVRIMSLEKEAARYKALAQNPGAEHRQIEKDKLASMEKASDDALQWLGALKEKQEKQAKHEEPVLLCSHIQVRLEELSKLAESVLGRAAESSPVELPGGSPEAAQHDEEAGDKSAAAQATPENTSSAGK